MAGIGTRLLKLTIDGDEVTAEISKCVISSGASDTDFVTFQDAASGGARLYTLDFAAVQDAVTGSLWDTVFTAAGSTVPCVLKPYGNAVASPAQPHFGFDAVVQEPDGDFLGAEANKSNTARATFECSWPLEGKPTRITA